jgi:hypothetical protein
MARRIIIQDIILNGISINELKRKAAPRKMQQFISDITRYGSSSRNDLVTADNGELRQRRKLWRCWRHRSRIRCKRRLVLPFHTMKSAVVVKRYPSVHWVREQTKTSGSYGGAVCHALYNCRERGSRYDIGTHNQVGGVDDDTGTWGFSRYLCRQRDFGGWILSARTTDCGRLNCAMPKSARQEGRKMFIKSRDALVVETNIAWEGGVEQTNSSS